MSTSIDLSTTTPTDLAPHANSETITPYTQDAIERKVKNDKFLLDKGFVGLEAYPPIAGRVEATPRSAKEAAKRAMAFFTVALRAEIANKEKRYHDNNEQPTPEVALKHKELKQELSIANLKQEWPMTFATLTDVEKEFLTQIDAPDAKQLIDFSWKYESLNLLLWSLNIIDELTYPPTRCKYIPHLVKTMLADNEKHFTNQARLRPTNELLDTLDLYYRLNRVTTEHPQNIRLDSGVIMERYYTLHWLLNSN